jgi:hypothetical protein
MTTLIANWFFAVVHVSQMLNALKADYITPLGTVRGRGIAMKLRRRLIKKRNRQRLAAPSSLDGSGSNGQRRAQPAPLPFLLRVKCGLLSQQFSDQFFGAINRDLIAYREQYFSVPLNLCVEFDALIAHRVPLEPRNGAALIGRLIVKTTGRENCSLRDLEHFDRPGTGTSAKDLAREPASLRRMKLALQPADRLFSPERIGAIAVEALKRARPFAARRQR